MRASITRPPLGLSVMAVVLLMALNAQAGNTFTIAVIPDAQNYTDDQAAQPSAIDVFTGQMNYVVNNRTNMNIVFTTFLGDIVQHGDGTDGTSAVYGGPNEYNRARGAVDILAASGMPFGITIGNHDYDSQSYVTGSHPLASKGMFTS